jgi:hypothetical protein
MNSEAEEDGLARAEVAPELVPDLRLYRRLWLSRLDLEEAKATVEELLRVRIPLPRRNLPSPLLMAFTTALVVSYARPFVNSRGQSAVAERTVPGSLLRVLSSKQRTIHERLVQMRNREIVHSDADILELYLQLHIEGDSAILRETRNPFHREELRDILRIIKRLGEEVERRCEELRKVLPTDVWI